MKYDDVQVAAKLVGLIDCLNAHRRDLDGQSLTGGSIRDIVVEGHYGRGIIPKEVADHMSSVLIGIAKAELTAMGVKLPRDL